MLGHNYSPTGMSTMAPTREPSFVHNTATWRVEGLFSLSLPLLSHTLTLGETYPLFNPNDATKVVQSVQLFDTLVYKQKTTFKVGDWIQHIGCLNHFTNT